MKHWLKDVLNEPHTDPGFSSSNTSVHFMGVLASHILLSNNLWQTVSDTNAVSGE